KLPHLESVNLCACKHLTDRSMKALCRNSKHLKELNLSWIRNISESAIIDLVRNCPNLDHLDIYDHKVSREGIETLTEMAKDRNITIVLKGLTDSEVAPENPCAKLPFFGKQCH
ncbi:F-box/LRR-repeat protein 15-like, partial [Mizuhopecten yessoensis]|uniref:F-box/LRR-repeat protein 15-like n=1 Tax=Mizuhopecten yessoensis TaxID=6573 RepID=UPI000B45BA7E